MHWVQITDAWNGFFHAQESCAPLVLFRLLFGSLLIVNALLLFPLVEDCFGTNAIWNMTAWQKHQGRSRMCLLHLLPATTGGFRILLIGHLVASVGFLIGWQFQACAIAAFVTMASIHHRNTFILSGGDTVLRLLSFLAIFAPASLAWSVDAMRNGESVIQHVDPLIRPIGHLLPLGGGEGRRIDATGGEGTRIDATAGEGIGAAFPLIDVWPLRLMQILISIVYLRTVFWKLRGKMWWNGTAAWYPVWVDTYLRNRPPRWMLRPVMIRIATWGTLLGELSLGSLIWIQELRVPVILVGIVMHLVFEVILNLQLFGWVMIAGLLLFLPPEIVEKALSALW